MDLPIEVVTSRHNQMIDPGLQVWGWEIPVYLFLGGLAAGMIALAALLELTRKDDTPSSNAVRLVPFAALGVLSLGMLTLFLDLENRGIVLRFFLAFKPSSPMSWGSWILMLIYPAGLMFGLGSLSGPQRDRILGLRALALLRGPIRSAIQRADAWRPAILRAAIVAGAALGLYTGLLLGTLVARPQWNSAVLGPLFLASGCSTGAAFLLLFPLNEAEHRSLVRWDAAAIVIELSLIGLLIAGYATGGEPARHALYHVFGGPWTAAFWALVVVAGLIVPLAMEWIGVRRKLPLAVIAPVLILIGGLSLRFVLMAAGQASSFREFP